MISCASLWRRPLNSPLLILGLLLWIGTAPASASGQEAYAGTRVIDTEIQFDDLVKNLKQAIKDNGMGLVAAASASRGAASRGIHIPGNAVLMVFRNDYAVRMLAASIAAGIEAPLRIYVTEKPEGTAKITYRLPSAVFGPYNRPALDEMALELDVIFGKITNDAITE